MTAALDVLVYGYGNPGRQDDGLGVALAQQAEQSGAALRVDSNYQLAAEDALTIADADVVIFADATTCDDVDAFAFSVLRPAGEIAFSTHSMSPASVLALCRELYAKQPDAYLLQIRGEAWGLQEGLTQRAAGHLRQALAFLGEVLKAGSREAFAQAAQHSRDFGSYSDRKGRSYEQKSSCR